MGDFNLVTIDLSPRRGPWWGDCARSIFVEGGSVRAAPSDREFSKGQKFITDVAWKDLDTEFLNAVSAWNAWAPTSGSQNDGTATWPHAIALPALSDL